MIALLVFSWYCVVAGWGLHYILMALVDAFAGKSAQQVGELFELFRSSGQLNVLFQVLFLAATEVVRAAKTNNTKNNTDNNKDPGNCSKINGKVLKMSPSPSWG